MGRAEREEWTSRQERKREADKSPKTKARQDHSAIQVNRAGSDSKPMPR